MIPRIFHQTSKTKDLTWEERRLTARLRRMHPNWEYHLWDDADNEALIRSHFPQHADAYVQIEKGVIKADIARYAYMSVYGGVYLDTDYKVLRPFDDEILKHSAVLPFERGERVNNRGVAEFDPTCSHLGNAILLSTPQFPLWADFITHLFTVALTEPTVESDIVKLSGPVGLTRYWHPRRQKYFDVFVPERNEFYPEIFNFALRTSSDITTRGVHLCWGSWRGRAVGESLKTVIRRKLNAF